MSTRDTDPNAAGVAAGLLPASVDAGGPSDELRRAVGDVIGPSSWWRSGDPDPAAPVGGVLPSWRRRDGAIDVEALSAAFDEAAGPPGDGRPEFVRVRVDTEDALVGVRTLDRAWSAPVVASFTSRGSLSKPLVWRWPFRVGVVGPAPWLESIRAYWHHGSLYVAEPAVGGARYEIAVVPADALDDPLVDEVARSSTCVIGVGSGSAVELMESVDRVLRPVIAVGVAGPPDRWWVPFVETLTHDCPIDVAVDAVRRLADVDAVVAGPELGLDVTAPSRWLVAVERDRPDLAGIADDVGQWDWTSEGGGSTETSGRARNAASPDGELPVVVVDAVGMAMGEPEAAAAPDEPTAAGGDPGTTGTATRPGRFVHAIVDSDDADRTDDDTVADSDGGRLSLVADRPNDLRCWIGPDRGEGAVSTDAVPSVDRDLLLRVELLVGRDVVAEGTMLLPKGPTGRSSDCVLQVPAQPAGRFTGELAFTHEGRMYELVSVLADVVAADDDDADVAPLQLRSLVGHRQVIDVDDRSRSSGTIDVTEVDGEIVVREFGRLGPGVFDLEGRRELVETLMGRLYGTTKSLVRRDVHGMAGAVVDPEWTALVRELATHGWILHRTLHQQGFGDPGERFEVINRAPDTYVPVELLYDRGAPADDAPVDLDCLAAMAAGADDCGRCHRFSELTDAERDKNPRICPFGFWSLRKVIERHDPIPAGPGAAPNDPAATIELRSPDRAMSTLRPLDTVLAGWSVKVRDEDQLLLTEGLSAPGRNVLVAENWTSWQQHLDATPALLVALPHHDPAGIGTLEIRDDSSLGLQRALDTFVRVPDGAAPPVLLLLGCESDGVHQLGHPSFAREFGPYASVVVGTLSKVLGRHAAPFAREFVATLAAAQADGGDVGTVMRDVRRRMFAEGYLMALGVISLGDADWRLAAPTEDDT